MGLVPRCRHWQSATHPFEVNCQGKYHQYEQARWDAGDKWAQLVSMTKRLKSADSPHTCVEKLSRCINQFNGSAEQYEEIAFDWHKGSKSGRNSGVYLRVVCKACGRATVRIQPFLWDYANNDWDYNSDEVFADAVLAILIPSQQPPQPQLLPPPPPPLANKLLQTHDELLQKRIQYVDEIIHIGKNLTKWESLRPKLLAFFESTVEPGLCWRHSLLSQPVPRQPQWEDSLLSQPVPWQPQWEDSLLSQPVLCQPPQQQAQQQEWQ